MKKLEITEYVTQFTPTFNVGSLMNVVLMKEFFDYPPLKRSSSNYKQMFTRRQNIHFHNGYSASISQIIS